jgi:glutamyl-tRNA synthetase
MTISYRGRIAPTPTGYLHLGHARTFWIAMERARQAGGQLIFRDEDIDPQRCKEIFSLGAIEDLRWFGCDWHEGPDVGGRFGPYIQSQRYDKFINAWQLLREADLIYPCKKSRKDVDRAAHAPHSEEEKGEAIYPTSWRPPSGYGQAAFTPGESNWRFRVPDGRKVGFDDLRLGPCSFECLKDFGDFLVWRRDGGPAYELAVVVDDAAMQITEVVRGEDLLLSTARQLLIYEALSIAAPSFYHAPLLCDATGRRMAKRNHSQSLRELRAAGHTPDSLRQSSIWLD